MNKQPLTAEQSAAQPDEGADVPPSPAEAQNPWFHRSTPSFQATLQSQKPQQLVVDVTHSGVNVVESHLLSSLGGLRH